MDTAFGENVTVLRGILMELIDKRDLKRTLEFYCIGCNHMNGVKCSACDIGKAFDAIEDTHPIDAVQVVRCKNCNQSYENVSGIYCRYHFSETEPDFYCADGEPKESEV